MAVGRRAKQLSSWTGRGAKQLSGRLGEEGRAVVMEVQVGRGAKQLSGWAGRGAKQLSGCATRLLEEVQRNFPVGLRSDRDFHGCRKRCRVVCCRGSPWLLDEVRSNFPADWAAQYKAKGIGAKPLSRQGLRRCEEASDPGRFWYMLCVTYFLKKTTGNNR